MGDRSGAGRGLRVLAAPAFRNRALNPYNALLYAAVARVGVAVDDLSPRALLRLRPDVLHLHWPEYLFGAPGLWRSVLQALAFVLVISGLRRRRTRVVWTIHNLRGHDRWHERLEGTMWRWFVRRVDGYIALTPGGQAAAVARFPDLRSRPGFVIPHGHYRDEYPHAVTRGEARDALGLPRGARVVGFFGAIRAYKNVPELIAAFRSVPGDGWRLLVAGQPATAELAAALRRGADDDRRIRLDLDYVARERVQLYLRAADLLVFPYSDVLNSGSALLALSFDRPVLVPERGAMAELRQAVGEQWVRTYRGALAAATLVEAMSWAETVPRDADRLRALLDWDAIARQTVLAYEAVVRTGATGLPVGAATVAGSGEMADDPVPPHVAGR
jgi:beta-1,4-mannosyltransferase